MEVRRYMSLGLKYKNNEHEFAEAAAWRCAVSVLSAFWKIQESSTTFSTRLGGVSTGCFSSMNISLTRGDDPEAVKKES